MRKILIFATVTFFAFYSCDKKTENSLSNLQNLSKHTVSASGLLTEPLGVDLTGFQLLDMCSSEVCTTMSGTVVFYIDSDGSFKALCVNNFVFRYRTTTIYNGEYSVDLERFSLFGEVGNTYNLTFNPRSNNASKIILAMVHLNFKGNGLYTIRIDSGAIKC